MPFDPEEFSRFKASPSGFDPDEFKAFKSKPATPSEKLKLAIPGALEAILSPVKRAELIGRVSGQIGEAGFRGVKRARELSEEIGPELAQRGIPPIIAAGVSALPRTALEYIPTSPVELGATILGGPLLRGTAGAARGAAVGVRHWLRRGFPEAVAAATNSNVEAVKKRVLSAVDPFSSKLTKPEVIEDLLRKTGQNLRAYGDKFGKTIKQFRDFLDEKAKVTIGTNKLVPTALIKAIAKKTFTSPDTGQVAEVLKPIFKTLTPAKGFSEGPLQNVSIKAASEMLRKIRDLVDYRIGDPIAVRMIPVGSNEERLVKDFAGKFRDSIVIMAQQVDPVYGSLYGAALRQFSKHATGMEQLSKELLGQGEPETKLMKIFARGPSGKLSRLEEIAQDIPFFNRVLKQAEKAFVSQRLKGEFRPAITGASLLPSVIAGGIGSAFGGPTAGLISAAAPIATSLLFAPRPGTAAARSIIRKAVPALRGVRSIAKPIQRTLGSPFALQSLRAGLFE